MRLRLVGGNAWIGLLLATVFLAGPGFSQNFNATLSGRVTDPSGAVIPNASVTLTSDTTGAVARTQSNSNGYFTFPNLAPAPYTLRVTAKGFRDYVQRGIVLLMNQNVTNNVTMQLGSEVQTVKVSANASPLNYSTPTLK